MILGILNNKEKTNFSLEAIINFYNNILRKARIEDIFFKSNNNYKNVNFLKSHSDILYAFKIRNTSKYFNNSFLL